MEHTTPKPVAPDVSENDHTYYTVAQVAQRYGVSTRVIYEALSSGKIRGIRIGGWRISEEALQEFEQRGNFTVRRDREASEPVSKPSRIRRKRPIVTKISL